MFRNLSRRATLKLKSVLINLLVWFWLKPTTFAIKIINFFTQFLVLAKTKIVKEITLFELTTNTKLFLTTDSKRAPAFNPQITKKADEVEDWKEHPIVKRSIEELKRKTAMMQHEGGIGMIKRSSAPRSPDPVPKPLEGYTTTMPIPEDHIKETTEKDLSNALKNMVERMRAKDLVKEIKSESGKKTLKEIEKEVLPKKKKPSPKKKTNKKTATKPVSKKKKIRR